MFLNFITKIKILGYINSKPLSPTCFPPYTSFAPSLSPSAINLIKLSKCALNYMQVEGTRETTYLPKPLATSFAKPISPQFYPISQLVKNPENWTSTYKHISQKSEFIGRLHITSLPLNLHQNPLKWTNEQCEWGLLYQTYQKITVFNMFHFELRQHPFQFITWNCFYITRYMTN